MTDTRCPHCDHVFAMSEITEEWCEQCGKHIPEVLLKDARPKPHIRNPHPHPLPPPSKETQAESSHETRMRLTGLLTMMTAIIIALSCVVWGVVNQLQTAGIGNGPWAGGGVALVVFVVGALYFNRGETSEE